MFQGTSTSKISIGQADSTNQARHWVGQIENVEKHNEWSWFENWYTSLLKKKHIGFDTHFSPWSVYDIHSPDKLSDIWKLSFPL